MSPFLMSLIAAYLFFCIAVAYAGRKVAIGFGGVFVLSILITPLLTALFIIVFRPRFRKKEIE